MPLDIWSNDGTGLWGDAQDEGFQPLGLTGVDPQDLPRSARNAVFNQLAPTPDEVAAKEEEQAGNAWGTIGSILSLPEKVLFGQAIKGAVKGGIEGGWEGALKGFARGTPFAFLGEALGLGDLADETSFAEIRRATGETDVEEGAANFLLNLAGDIVLSPVELLAAPFAVTKGASVAGRIASKASIAKGIALGERAALTFRVPFAKNAFYATNLGFKSGAVTVGQGIDAIGAFMRTNPVTGALVKTFSPVARVKDPEVAQLGKLSRAEADQARRTFFGKTLTAYLDGVTPQGRALVESGRFRGLLTTMNEFGAASVDELGTYDEALRKLANPDVALREIKRDALLRSNRRGAVGELWDKASAGDVDAIGTLHARHTEIPLTKEMLDAAGLKPRVGSELSWVTEADQGVVGQLDPATRGLRSAADSAQGKRLVAAEATPDRALDAAKKARTGLQDDYRKLMAEIEAGTVNKADLDSFLSVHKQVMTDIGRADILNGFLNETVEPFLGLYAPRMISAKAMEMVENHFAATLSKYNYSSPRKLRDMLAVEVNAVVEDFGTKATGFIPLKELRKHKADGVLARIFDSKFRKELAAFDPQAAEFFQILPTQNLFERAAVSGEREARATFGRTFFADDSAAVVESLTPEEFAKRGGRYGPGTGYRAVVETKSGVETPTWAKTVERQAAPEIEAQYEIASHTIRKDSLDRMLDTRRDFDAEWHELRAARDITADSAPVKLQQAKDDAYATVTMKRAANDLRMAKEEKDLAERLLRIHRARAKGVGATADADAVRVYDQILDAEVSAEASSKQAAINERLTKRLSEIDSRRAKISDEIATRKNAAKNASDAADMAAADFDFEARYVGKSGEDAASLSSLSDRAVRSDAFAERFADRAKAKISDLQEEIRALNAERDAIQFASRERAVVGSRSAAMSFVEDGLRERLGRAKDVLRSRGDFYEASKRSINDFLDELDKTFDAMTGEFSDAVKANRAGRRDALAGILSDKKQRAALVDRLRQNGVSGRTFAREVSLQQQYAARGVMALDEAATIPLEDGTGRSLLDRMRERWGKDTRIKIVTEEAFNAFRELSDDMAKPDALRDNGIARVLDTFKTAWAGHTIYNPLFLQTRARNFVQSVASSMAHGLFSPTAHFEARTALGTFSKSLKEGPGALEEIASQTVRGRADVSLKDALQAARKLGVVGAGGYAYEAGLTLEKAAARTSATPVKDALKDWRSYVDLVVPTRGVSDSPALQLGLRMEQTLDDHARFATFLGALKKGQSFEEAASSVRRALYDSTNPMSWTERTIFRRAIPFYSFQKYAFGQMADLYLTRPATVTTIEKVRRNAYAATGMKPEELDTAMPGFVADGYAIPYKNTDKGPVFGLFGTYLPIGEVARIASMFDDYKQNPDGADPVLRYFVGNMHPVLKSSLESLLNRDVYSNREITDYPGQSLEMFGIPMPKLMVRFAQQLRFVNELNKLNVINFTEASALLSEVKRFGSDETTALDRLLSSAFSPSPIPQDRTINVEQETKYRNRKDEARFREAKGRIVRAGIGEDRAYTETNIEALRAEMAETAARIRRRDRLAGRYTQTDPERPTTPTNPLERLLLGR